jgi:F-type H+-transporting ATPase subunit epsilon
MKLSVVTPEKRIVTDVEATEVYVPGHRGELGILPGHAPLVTTLSTGILRWKVKGSDKEETAAVSWGYCEVLADQVTVLAETAEVASELDAKRAQDALDKAKAHLQRGDLSQEDREKYFNKLLRANSRLALVKSIH